MKKRLHKKKITSINVVPYIDVMLVLLVIFMVTAPLLNPGIVDLPSVGKSSTQPTAPIEITIKKDGSYLYTNRVNSKAMRKDKLENIIQFILNRQKKNPEQSVVISADKRVRYEKVMELLDLLQRNNIYKVGLLVVPK